MYDIHAVNVNYSSNNVFDVMSDFLFTEFAFFSERMIQLSAWSIFQNEVNLFIVKEETIHFENILIVHMWMNLNLSPNLIDNIRLPNLLFG